MTGLIAHRGAQLVGRQDLPTLVTPAATLTHKPVPHAQIVQALIESLAFRRFTVAEDQYAVTPDGMRMTDQYLCEYYARLISESPRTIFKRIH